MVTLSATYIGFDDMKRCRQWKGGKGVYNGGVFISNERKNVKRNEKYFM